jgi:ribosomal protein L40E
MGVKRLSCPACGASDFNHDAEGNLVCSYCGAVLESPREEIVCRVCGTVNPGQALRCMKCGSNLGAICSKCRTINLPGAQFCEKCAEPLDTLSGIISRFSDLDGDGIVERGEVLTATKSADAEYLARERARLMAEDRRRAAILTQRSVTAQKKQKILMIIVYVVIGLLAVGGMVAAILYALSIASG